MDWWLEFVKIVREGMCDRDEERKRKREGERERKREMGGESASKKLTGMLSDDLLEGTRANARGARGGEQGGIEASSAVMHYLLLKCYEGWRAIRSKAARTSKED